MSGFIGGFISFSTVAAAEEAGVGEPTELKGQEGLDYITIYGSLLEARSLGTNNQQAQIFGGGIALGTFITDTFRTEFRIGTGITDDSPDRNATIEYDEYISWYIGAQHAISTDAKVYALLGFSSVQANADIKNRDDTSNPFRREKDELIDNQFGFSWVAGLDVRLFNQVYLMGEGGFLHRDGTTDIKTLQFNLGLRYDY